MATYNAVATSGTFTAPLEIDTAPGFGESFMGFASPEPGEAPQADEAAAAEPEEGTVKAARKK